MSNQYLLVTNNFLIIMYYFLLVTMYDFSFSQFTCFSEVKKFKVILKAKSAVSRLEMCLAQPGYGSGLLPSPSSGLLPPK